VSDFFSERVFLVWTSAFLTPATPAPARVAATTVSRPSAEGLLDGVFAFAA
jgi:hypothetical protein